MVLYLSMKRKKGRSLACYVKYTNARHIHDATNPVKMAVPSAVLFRLSVVDFDELDVGAVFTKVLKHRTFVYTSIKFPAGCGIMRLHMAVQGRNQAALGFALLRGKAECGSSASSLRHPDSRRCRENYGMKYS